MIRTSREYPEGPRKMMENTNIHCNKYGRHCSKSFALINSSNPQNKPMKYMLLFLLFTFQGIEAERD